MRRGCGPQREAPAEKSWGTKLRHALVNGVPVKGEALCLGIHTWLVVNPTLRSIIRLEPHDTGPCIYNQFITDENLHVNSHLGF
jgi:hypothetical protein